MRKIMVSLIQKIATQTELTFSKQDPEKFHENLQVLLNLVAKVKPSDVNLRVDQINDKKIPTPVSYMPIYDNDSRGPFTISVFMLKAGARIPLHDHPGMHGIIKVLHGTITVKSYTKVVKSAVSEELLTKENATSSSELLTVANEPVHINESCEPCCLTPSDRNYHEITVESGKAVFLDILSPPYGGRNTERDCHYFSENGVVSAGSPPQQFTFLSQLHDSPDDFECSSYAYRGPKITLGYVK